MLATPPLSTDPLQFSFPKVQKVELDDGTPIYIIEKDDEDLVTVQLYLRSGSAHDTTPGASAFASELLTRGAGSRTAHEFDLAVETLGCSVRTYLDRSSCSITGLGMAKNLGPLLELLSEAVRDPHFSEEELETLKGRWISETMMDQRDPDWLAGHASNRVTYAGHPYETPRKGTIATMQLLTRDDIVGAHKRLLESPRVFIVAGPLNANEVVKSFGEYFKGLPKASFDNVLPQAKISERAGCIALNKDAVQTAVRISLPCPGFDHPDHAAVQLITSVLGGYTLARLFMSLREEKGYTYGAYAANMVTEHARATRLITSVGNDFTTDTFKTINDEVRRIATERIDDEELENSRQHVLGMFARSNETPQQTASLWWTTILHGLPPNYFELLIQRLQQYTPEDLMSAQERWFNADRWAVAASGDPQVILPAIEDYTDTVEIWNVVTGEPA